MMKTIILSICASMSLHLAHSQSYTSYFAGNATDIVTQPQFGICLMGGAGESDDAMIWFLERANGGDVLVLRASGADGYNDYMYSDLGVSVNSVETIVFNNAAAASDPYVIGKVNNAEAIWFAGGDQGDYIDYWKGTAIEDGINNLINVKQGPVGGISAGMAILGQAYFSASQGTITEEQALANPFAPQMVIGYDDFLEVPFLENVITETHFNDPDRIRYGRIVAFMARLGFDQGIIPLGIASNEYGAIAIDEFGLARAFGEYPEFEEDLVYFLQPNCEGPQGPELIASGSPLTWNRSQEAVKVYQVPATVNGENTFDLTNWHDGVGGTWENWYVEAGVLTRTENAAQPNCFLGLESLNELEIKLYPNPAQSELWLSADIDGIATYRIFDLSGRILQEGTKNSEPWLISLHQFTAGYYYIELSVANRAKTIGFIKTP